MEGLVNSVVHMLANLYALMAVVPFVSFILLWFLFYWILNNKKEASRRTMDITAVLLIGSVSSMYYRLFESSFGFFLILFVMLVSYGLIGNMQYRSKGTIAHRRLIQITLRLGFFGLSAAYIILLLVGMVQYYSNI
jgi:hypothetical protein